VDLDMIEQRVSVEFGILQTVALLLDQPLFDPLLASMEHGWHLSSLPKSLANSENGDINAYFQ
jgi:hypothetical protein